MSRYLELIKPRLAESGARVQMGDAQWREAEGPRTLLQEAGFEGVTTDAVEGELRMSPSDLWDWFLLMYDPYFLDAQTVAAMGEQFISSMQTAVDTDGHVGLPIAWRLVQATA